MFLFATLTLVVGGGGTLAALAFLGVVDLPFLRSVVPPRDPHAGMVAVLACGQPIEAYSKVTRDHLANPETGELMLLFRKPEEVKPDWIRDVGDIVGRVVRYDKQPGYVFTERDFFPKGTRPGVAGGIPPGKRAMMLEVAKVKGLGQLAVGDRFDLLASVALKDSGGGPRVRTAAGRGGAGAAGSTAGHAATQASVRVLVVGGALVAMPTSKDANGKDVKEATIALDPEEIAPLTEALATGASLFCVAHSGQPEDDSHRARTIRVAPPPEIVVIETVRNRQFGAEAFPARPEDAPRAAASAPLPGASARDRVPTGHPGS